VGIRPEFRWWILTLAVVVVLLVISLLAMDRPNVSWFQGTAHCPHCAADAPSGSSRCQTCREQYDWVVAPDSESPLSPWSLSALEAEHVRGLIHDLGEQEAPRRVAAALEIPKAVATRYLQSIGRGRCGWCGGLGFELRGLEADKGSPCPVCFGRKWCVACNGDRRIRVGDLEAERALGEYLANLMDVAPTLPPEVQRMEARRLNEAFTRRFAGTRQAAYLVFWPTWEAHTLPLHVDPLTLKPRFPMEAPVSGARPTGAALSGVRAARRRLDHVLAALRAE
jgi:hypothetical protein